MEKKSFLWEIKKFIEEHKETYSDKVLVSSVMVNDGGLVWYNCMTKFRLIGKEEKIIPRKDIIYDVFGLLELIISIKDMIKILENVERSFKIKDFEINFKDTVDFNYRTYEASNNDYCDFAGNEYWIGGSTVYPIRFPTIKYGVPCFRDGNHAIRNWLSLEKFHDFSDARLGKIILFIPNFKARFRKLEFENNCLNIYIEGDKTILKDLECQLVYTIEKELFQKNIKINGKNNISLNIENEPDEIFLQLVTSKGEKIDYYEDTPYRHTGKSRLLKRESNKEILDKIKDGENENVEFKPFIEKRNTKEIEVINTIIAFANTRGGSLIFGVDDYCKIIGVPRNILKRLDFNAFFEDYKKNIRKLISDKVNKKIVMVFNKYVVGTDLIIEIIIEEGENKPYATVPDNKIYVRKGSNNRFPDTDVELPHLLRK